ncbi:MAG: cytochrome c-type biogenesis protein CcmH [Acidimicrobiia bacterium]|nr:cytochrome c-type biogenesis protein CcmH [Acidimicrobiia bacterium]MYC58406.1 cytochrome c-type biogenesis protein CcmH [Acidimicrobiia bacterium]MYG94165.1 cytochrome c-type biogenesis protein CcmH [Acidimicrobiia bacterium]MYI30488.1 cytochrome c-type biogenesis protein CcmH [Acidimicrobiia bacterium]
MSGRDKNTGTYRQRWVVVSWLLVGISASSMLVFGTLDSRDDRSNAERVYDIGSAIACPQCVGQSVVQSDVAIAREIRAEIGQLVVAGYSDDDIRSRFAERYGEWVILTPSRSGLSGLIWVIPVAGLAVGAGLLMVTLSRWQRASQADVEVSEADLALVKKARAQEELASVEESEEGG